MKISVYAFRILSKLADHPDGTTLEDMPGSTIAGLKRNGWIHDLGRGRYKLALKGLEFMARPEREILNDVKPLR